VTLKSLEIAAFNSLHISSCWRSAVHSNSPILCSFWDITLHGKTVACSRNLC